MRARGRHSHCSILARDKYTWYKKDHKKRRRKLLYTAGLLVSHLQLLFVVVVVLTNHNKPRWLTCDPTRRACGEYITWCRSSEISNHKDNKNRINTAEGYANSSYNWPNMNWAAAYLSKEWERFYQHCDLPSAGLSTNAPRRRKYATS